MTVTRKIRWRLLIWYLTTPTFAILSWKVSPWFWLGVIYNVLHLFAGPLDWYYLYKSYKWLKHGHGEE